MIRLIRRLAGICLFAAGYLLPIVAQAQSGANEGALSKLTVSSPTAGALAKFADFPTSSYSGTPEISIPLYTISTSFAQLPLTLSYHAGGIRVNQNATSSGLGWSITGPGVVNRTIYGKADDGSWLSNDGVNWVSQALDFNNSTIYQRMQSLGNNLIDGVPDPRTYTMAGYSGKFIITDSIRQMPLTGNQITVVNADEYRITTPDGVVYIFNEPERSFNKSATSASSATTAWYLTKMLAPDRSDSIVFIYKNTAYETDMGRSYSLTITQNSGGGYNGGSNNTATYMSRISGKELSRIEYKNGSVDFDLTWNTREDLYGVDSAALVNAIVVKNSNNTTIRRVSFRYDYFVSAGTVTAAHKRLRLIGAYIHLNGATDTTNAERYNFFYNSTLLPTKNSLAQDHWGYYNGASNSTLVPGWRSCTDGYTASNCRVCSLNPNNYVYNGANREANANFMMAGMLERINLPTGGYRAYEWEAHQAPNPDSGKISYNTTSFLTAQAAPTNSTFVTDSSSDFYVDPAIYPSGICGRIYGSLGSASEDPTELDHAGAAMTLYRRSGSNRIIVKGYGFSSTNMSVSETVSLQAGQTYFILVKARHAGMTSNGELTGFTPASYAPKNRIIGGPRIKKISLYDHITGKTIVNRYEYTLPNYPALSSAITTPDPIYAYTYTSFQKESACNYTFRQGAYLSGNSIYSIGAGSHIGYTYVKESQGESNDAGYTLYQFSNEFAEGGEFDPSWRRGLLLAKTDYNKLGTPVKKTENFYSTDSRGFKHYQGWQVVNYQAHPCASPTIFNENYPVFMTFKGYYFPSEWLHLDSSVTTTYDMLNPAKINRSIQNTYYDNTNHKLPTRTITNDSRGWVERTTTKYAADYTLPGGTLTGEQLALQNLQQKNQQEVIEKYSQKYNPASPALVYTIAGQYNSFKMVTVPYGSHAQPDTQFTLDADNFTTNFSPSAVSGATISKDGRYTMDSRMVSYDNNFNITEVQKATEPNSAYLWDYKGDYLVAKVANATQALIAYTSFEADSKGNWTYNGTPGADATAPTGGMVYTFNASNNITKTNLVASQVYTLSYWTKNATAFNVAGNQGTPVKSATAANGWYYYEHRITGVTTISIGNTGSIDEVRLYPAGAQMNTYTYTPKVGVTSSCDQADKVIRNTYDAAGRLITITDREGKLQKVYEYQYAVPMAQ